MAEVETTLDMERRHVREGLARIAAQEALILRLQMNDPGGLLPKARELLAAPCTNSRRPRTNIWRGCCVKSGVPGPVKGMVD